MTRCMLFFTTDTTISNKGNKKLCNERIIAKLFRSPLVFESLHRSRNTAASVNHNSRRFFVDIHNGASSEKS